MNQEALHALVARRARRVLRDGPRGLLPQLTGKNRRRLAARAVRRAARAAQKKELAS